MVPRSSFAAIALVAIANVACSSSSNATAPSPDAGPDASACNTSGDRPSARAEMYGVMDTKRAKVVFFGGDTGVPKQCMPAPHPSAELWSYDTACSAWTNVAFTDGPGARQRGVAVYDGDGDRMVVFGGRYRMATAGAYTVYDETWTLDLAMMTWTKVTPTGMTPPARSSTAAVYDPMTKAMIVFGGNTSTNGAAFAPLADVWSLNLASSTWTPLATKGTPPAARLFHTASLDPANRKLYVFGGGDANAFTGPFFNDVWELDLTSSTWTELVKGDPNGPAGRINASSMWDAASSRLLIFGGHDDGNVGNNNDTWAFDPSSKKWTNIVPPETVKTMPAGFCLFPPDFTTPNTSAPDRRSSHLAVVDSVHASWTVFGGETDCGLIDDMWTFDLVKNTWSRVMAARVGEACTRGPNTSQCTTLCL
jgi:N-acetylneuraminic acid mutarotase